MDVGERLLTGARTALERHGLSGATMERIAAEAGTTRMTLHRHGIKKQTILDALAARLQAEYREAMWPALVGDGSARERLVGALEGQCRVAEDNLVLLDALEDPERAAIFHERGGRGLTERVYVEPLERLLHDGIADGSLAADDVDETATVLFNIVGRTYRHLRSGHGWTPERARAAVIRLAVEGVAGR
jgi:AcrR family transcriptional regulator